MRIGGVILGVASLLGGFLEGPFDHIHPEELEHRPTSAPVHLHVPVTLEGQGPFIASHTADDDEIDVLWTAATSANVVVHADGEIAEPVSVAARWVVSATILIPRPRAHDPPEFSSKIPRAPPA